MGGAELRRSPRIELRIPVRLRWQDRGGKAQEATGEANQVSFHGVRMTAGSNIVSGTVVEIENPGNQLRAHYRVVWAVEASVPGFWQLGLELVDGAPALWGIDFPEPE